MASNNSGSKVTVVLGSQWGDEGKGENNFPCTFSVVFFSRIFHDMNAPHVKFASKKQPSLWHLITYINLDMGHLFVIEHDLALTSVFNIGFC